MLSSVIGVIASRNNYQIIGTPPISNFRGIPLGVSFSFNTDFSAWERNPDPSTPMLDTPLPWEIQQTFRLNAPTGTPITFEGVEAVPPIPSPATIINKTFIDPSNGIQVTVSGSEGDVVAVPPGQVDLGRHSMVWTSTGNEDGAQPQGTNFLWLRSTGRTINFQFSEHIAGFGFYLGDYLNFGGPTIQGILRAFSGNTELLSTDSPSTGFRGTEARGSVGFLGIVSLNHISFFDRVTLTTSSPIPSQVDIMSIDNLFISSIEQKTTAPFSVTAGTDIQFSDISENIPSSWLWNFGDGTFSTVQNPIKVYNSPGVYDVSLMVTNSAGSDTFVRNDYVIVI